MSEQERRQRWTVREALAWSLVAILGPVSLGLTIFLAEAILEGVRDNHDRLAALEAMHGYATRAGATDTIPLHDEGH